MEEDVNISEGVKAEQTKNQETARTCEAIEATRRRGRRRESAWQVGCQLMLTSRCVCNFVSASYSILICLFITPKFRGVGYGFECPAMTLVAGGDVIWCLYPFTNLTCSVRELAWTGSRWRQVMTNSFSLWRMVRLFQQFRLCYIASAFEGGRVLLLLKVG